MYQNVRARGKKEREETKGGPNSFHNGHMLCVVQQLYDTLYGAVEYVHVCIDCVLYHTRSRKARRLLHKGAGMAEVLLYGNEALGS